MSTPDTSAAPAAPSASTLIRGGLIASIIEWWNVIRTWILGLSPAGASKYDTKWQAITPNAGLSAEESLAWRRIGKVVYLRGGVKRASGTYPSLTWEDVFTLPDEARPGNYTRGGAATFPGSNSGSACFDITAAGLVRVALPGINGLAPESDIVRFGGVNYPVD